MLCISAVFLKQNIKNTLKCTPDNIYLVPKVRLLNCVSNNNDSFVEEWSIKKNVGYMFLQSF